MSEAAEKESCETCRFWILSLQHSILPERPLGYCRRRAPVKAGYDIHPTVEPTWWCGEYEEKKT